MRLLLITCLPWAWVAPAVAACDPLVITNPPATITAPESCRATFTVGMSGSAPMTFQWRSNGVTLAGATNAAYTTAPLTFEDNESFYSVVVSNECSTVTSGNAIVFVDPDDFPPKVSGAQAGPALNQLVVSFLLTSCGEPGAGLDPATAQDISNFSLAGGLQISSATLLPPGTNVLLTTSPQTPGGTYTVTVNNVSKPNGQRVPPNSTATFRTPAVSRGFLNFESWSRPPSGSSDCSTLITTGAPREQLFMTAFDTRTVYPDDSHDHYCAQVRGYFIPPVSGNWIFHLRSDESARLFLNPTGADPAGKVLILEETTCCRPFSALASAPQSLVAGSSYYIEGDYSEDIGSDYLQVAARLATDSTNPDNLSPIAAANLATLADPTSASVTILHHPSNVLALVNSPITFTVVAVGSIAGNTNPAIFYQWQRLGPEESSWADIPGANQPTLTAIFFSCEQSGNRLRCLVDVPGAAAISEPATVYVYGGDFFPVSIDQQPHSQIVEERCRLTLTVGARGMPSPSYQWFKGGIAISGATNSSYITPPVALADSGSVFSVIVSNRCSQERSSNATVVVVPNSVPPTLLGARGGSTLNEVVLSFLLSACGDSAGGLDPATAQTISNYSLSGGLTVNSVLLVPPGTNVILTTSPQTPGATYTVAVHGVTDTRGNSVPANSQATFTAPVLSQGFLRREVYTNIAGLDLFELTNNAKFPYHPDTVGFVTSFEAPSDVGDNYGQRLSGFLLPPVSGDYIFYLAADEQAALFLSTDEEPAHKVLLTFAPQWVGPRDWVELCADQMACVSNSAPVSLEAGHRYYVEALMKEAFTSDHLGVNWQLPGESVPTNGAPPIAGEFLAAYADPTSVALAITQQPQSVVAEVGHVATFSVEASIAPADTPALYQWLRNGVPIPDAHEPSFTTDILSANDGAVFSVILAVPGQTMNSAAATLTVVPDVTPPRIVSARREVCGPPIVVVVFDWLVEPQTATNTANYTISQGVTVLSAALRRDGRSVLLSTSVFTNRTPYRVAVRDVQDLAGNVIGGNASMLISAGDGPFTAMGPQNLLVVECEHFDLNRSPAASNGWTFQNGLPGYAGSGYMEAAPDINVTLDPPALYTNGPRLDYCLSLPVAGTYYVWLRGSTPDGAGNSVNIGLDGFSAGFIDGRVGNNTVTWGSNATAFGWVNDARSSPARVVASNAGPHTFNIWMREDGVRLDRFLLTTDATFLFSNRFAVGPPESLREAINVPALTIHRVGAAVIMVWDGDGILESTGDLGGTWSSVDGAASPYMTVSEGPSRFYRLRLP